MKRQSCLLFLLAALFSVTATAQPHDSIAMQWFRDAKFGLFLHWGLYSQTAGDWKGHPAEGGEHFMLYERIPVKEYAQIANDFNPDAFNARRWAKAAKRAGMKYVVITAKHHDGFAMFHSHCSDYNIVTRTPFARDPMTELAEACRKEGLKFGFYYSLGRDWEDPDVPTNWPVKGGRSNTWDYPDEDAKELNAYVERKVKPQLRELLTQYGRIDFLWFDTPELITAKHSADIRKLIHTLQPTCLINGRIGNRQGDYAIVEQTLTNRIGTQPWEACMTMGRNWCYNRYDTVYKAPDILVRHLADIVSKGGNLLLNIGPDGKGRFPSLTKAGLETFHRWMSVNGEAIYGTRPWHTFGEKLHEGDTEQAGEQVFHDAVFDGTPQTAIPDFRYTKKGNTIYVIVRHVAQPAYTLKAFGPTEKVTSVTCLGEKKAVKWHQSAEGLSIEMGPSGKRYPVYVLKVVIG